MRDLEHRLARLGLIEPSPGLDARVAAAIAAAERRAPARRRLALATALAVAGAVAFGILVWPGPPHGAPREPSPVLVELPPSPGLVELLQPGAGAPASFWERSWASLEVVEPAPADRPRAHDSARKEPP